MKERKCERCKRASKDIEDLDRDIKVYHPNGLPPQMLCTKCFIAQGKEEYKANNKGER